MTDPASRNRLDEEESPYLRQHADNPVNWQPWDDRALEAARERDVPIFLSVGYSACHWCHVMEEESFQDEEVAAVLNEAFVPVKVDREERPDLDRIYQTICQLVSGRGGWPLSAWLTPEGEPFYVGTYFPREPRRETPGFLSLCRDIADSWAGDREEIQRRARQWTDAVTDQLEDVPDAGEAHPGGELLGEAASALVRSADDDHGGFGSSGPKFPHPGRLALLLRADAVTDSGEAAAVATRTLDAMSAGGMYDQLGGGFHRYATDRSWTVPHFEKMLYDNAELPRVYLDAFCAYGDPRYARAAAETLAFVERELTHPEGGFYSTLSAVSVPPASRRDGDGSEEGAFYVWTPEEVRAELDDGVAELFCDRYGVTPGGNFEGGTSVLTLDAPVAALADEHDLPAETVSERLVGARTELFEAREDRPRPSRDEKVLAGWNGLMISAFAAGALVLGPGAAGTARDALGFVREHLWDPETGELSRRYKDASGPGPDAGETAPRAGDVKGNGYLEDYAFLARGAFDLYQATGEVEHLGFALELARVIEEEFWDADAGTLYFTPESGERLVARPQELTDQSTPSSLGVAVDLLLDLDLFTLDGAFGDIAERALATHGDRIRGQPTEHVSLVLAADKRDRGAVELTFAVEELPDAWRETLASRYLPAAVLAPRPPTQDGLATWLEALDLPEAPPIWRERGARDGEPTVYACESFTCSPPQSSVADALDWLAGDG